MHAVASDQGEDDVKVTAVLVAGATLSEEDLCRWCAERVPYFAIPRYIEFRADLPRNPVGRVLKYELRDDGVTADDLGPRGRRRHVRAPLSGKLAPRRPPVVGALLPHLDPARAGRRDRQVRAAPRRRRARSARRRRWVDGQVRDDLGELAAVGRVLGERRGERLR